MRVRFLSVTLLVLAASWLAPLSPVEACAQQTRDKPSRRVTNPARRQPTVPARATTAPAVSAAAQESPDVRLVSAADEQTPAEESAPRRNARRTGRARRGAEDGDAAPEEENLRATVNTLSTQVTRLAGEVNQLKDQQRTLVNLERLTRAEQRAEGLRAQLRDVVEKESALQGRREQLEYELRPENIQRRAAMTGSLNPSALRDEVQRQLKRAALAPGMAPARRFVPERDGWWDGYAFAIDPAFAELAAAAAARHG